MGNERVGFVSCLFVVGYGSKLLTVFICLLAVLFLDCKSDFLMRGYFIYVRDCRVYWRG